MGRDIVDAPDPAVARHEGRNEESTMESTESTQSSQGLAEDRLQLWCYEIPGPGTGLYHCDLDCTSASGGHFFGGATGPGMLSGTGCGSGGYELPNSNPGWQYKSSINPNAISAGVLMAPAGTCDCIRRKAAKMNQIKAKLYQVPYLDTGNISEMGNVSNSNALLSTLMNCCNVSIVPTKTAWQDNGKGKFVPKPQLLTAPGWGGYVVHRCETHRVLSYAIFPIVSCECPITCDSLK